MLNIFLLLRISAQTKRITKMKKEQEYEEEEYKNYGSIYSADEWEDIDDECEDIDDELGEMSWKDRQTSYSRKRTAVLYGDPWKLDPEWDDEEDDW